LKRAFATLSLATCGALGLVSAPLHTAPEEPRPVAHPRSATAHLTLTLSLADVPRGLSPAETEDALRRGAAAWSYPQIPCTALSLRVRTTDAPLGVEHDGAHAVMFHSRAWCRNGRRRHAACYSPRKVAITTPHFGRAREMSEADIEINAVHYAFAAQPKASEPSLMAADLETVLVHEIGHVLGFGHPSADGEGSVMVQSSDRGTERRALDPSDVAVVCRAYPRIPSMNPGVL
jgi:hypothetical protein